MVRRQAFATQPGRRRMTGRATPWGAFENTACVATATLCVLVRTAEREPRGEMVKTLFVGGIGCKGQQQTGQHRPYQEYSANV